MRQLIRAALDEALRLEVRAGSLPLQVFSLAGACPKEAYVMASTAIIELLGKAAA